MRHYDGTHSNASPWEESASLTHQALPLTEELAGGERNVKVGVEVEEEGAGCSEEEPEEA